LEGAFDIGIGQAGVYINGDDQEKSLLVYSKFQKVYEDYKNSLAKLTGKLKKKFGKTLDLSKQENVEEILKDTVKGIKNMDE
jgi:hypothetical protein